MPISNCYASTELNEIAKPSPCCETEISHSTVGPLIDCQNKAFSMQIIHAVGQLIACQEPAHCLSAISREVEGAPNSAGTLGASRSCCWFSGEWRLSFPAGGAGRSSTETGEGQGSRCTGREERGGLSPQSCMAQHLTQCVWCAFGQPQFLHL